MIGALKVNFFSRRAYISNDDIMLKPKEFSLLECLINNKDIPLTSQKLYHQVWGSSEHFDKRTVWVHISTLRKKLTTNWIKNCPKIILIRNYGYVLTLNEERYE